MSRTWSRAGGLLALVLLAGCAAAPVRQIRPLFPKGIGTA